MKRRKIQFSKSLKFPSYSEHSTMKAMYFGIARSVPQATQTWGDMVDRRQALQYNIDYSGSVVHFISNCILFLQIHCFSCCADAPVRAIMQNMLQYNGHYGCGWCLHPGTVINGGELLLTKHLARKEIKVVLYCHF